MAMQTAARATVDQIKIHLQKNEDTEAFALFLNLDVDDLLGVIGIELLHFAVKAGNRVVTNHLIDSGVNINVFHIHERSPLVKAVIQDADEKTLKAILYPITYSHREKPEGVLEWVFATDLSQCTIQSLILERLKRDSLSNIEVTVEKLILLNVKLCHAALLKDVEILEIMLNHNCLVSDIDPSTGRTALHVAVILRDLVTIGFLLQNGADINVIDAAGFIPFALACDYEDSAEETEILNYLLDQGSSLNIDFINDMDQKAYILMKGKRTIIRTLISRRDIEFSSQDQTGRTSLHYISRNDKVVNDQSIIEDLQQCSIDVNILSNDNESPLHGAAALRNFNLASFLLEKGANVNQQNINNVAALHLAISGCSLYSRKTSSEKKNIYNFIELLLRYGADPQLVAGNDRTVIRSISRRQCYDLAKLVLAYLALQVDRGIFITELVSNQINSDQKLVEEFELCQKDLQEIKDTRFHDSLTAFNLMFDSEKKIMLFARNEKVFDKLTEFYSTISSNSYFFDLLKQRLGKIFLKIKIRCQVADFLCQVLVTDYCAIPGVIDIIIDYLDDQDLQNVIQV